MAEHVYLSPHLDDAVYACGGLIALQTRRGDQVVVLSICAGDPPPGELTPFAQELHQRWQELRNPVERRRREDQAACEYLGARAIHLNIPDSVYRIGVRGEALYPTVESIFGDLHPQEAGLVEHVTDLLQESIPPRARIYAPLTVGGHVDHQLTRSAAERLGMPLWYYHELPYAVREGRTADGFDFPEGRNRIEPLGENEVVAWVEASQMYRSQISTFWKDESEIRDMLERYVRVEGGITLVGPLD